MRPALAGRAPRRVRRNLRILWLAAPLLPALLLGILQHHWIDEVSAAQEARVRARLHEEVALISDAIDAEATRAGVFFALPPAPTPSLYESLQERWIAWNRSAPCPRIVSGVAIVTPDKGRSKIQSLGDPGSFDLAWIPQPLPISRAPEPGQAMAVHAEFRLPDLFAEGRPYFLQPLPQPPEPFEPGCFSWLLIHYDLPRAADNLFRRLVTKYASAEDRLEFRFQLLPRGTVVPGTVAQSDAFRFRPDCLLHGNGSEGVTVNAFAGAARHISRSSYSVATRVGGGPSTLPESLLTAAAECRLPPSSASPGLMQLSVSHSQGSLVEMYSGFRRRNEFLSGGVTAILLAALGALVVSTERARGLARLQTAVAAGISHELRTPLASLSLAADDLRKGHVDTVAEARRYGEIIDAQSRRLRHVVEQALALHTLVEPQAAVSLRPACLVDILFATLHAFSSRLADAGIDVEHQVDPGLPKILAEPELVARCLSNLVENAIKYAASGRSLCVSVRGVRHFGRNAVELTLEDRGPGIPDDEADAVFEAFYRGVSARRSRQPGSGLGLSIVKRAVEAQGGWIRLERATPQGCRFRLFFRAADSEPAS